MDKTYFYLELALNECCFYALQARKNVNYMETTCARDHTKEEYAKKLRRMEQELPHLLRRANELRQILEEYNAIALR